MDNLVHSKTVWLYILVMLVLALLVSIFFNIVNKRGSDQNQTKPQYSQTRIPGESPSPNCIPYYCTDGTSFPSCTTGRGQINYLLNPCHDHGGETYINNK